MWNILRVLWQSPSSIITFVSVADSWVLPSIVFYDGIWLDLEFKMFMWLVYYSSNSGTNKLDCLMQQRFMGFGFWSSPIAYVHEWKDADICCFQSNEICRQGFLSYFCLPYVTKSPDLSAFKRLLRQTSMPVIVSLSDRPYVTFRNWMPLMGT